MDLSVHAGVTSWQTSKLSLTLSQLRFYDVKYNTNQW
jgi:hypothetical protein